MTDDNTKSLDSKWEMGFSVLQAFERETGSANPAKHYVTPEGFNLGRWLQTQRLRLRSGKLVPSRRALLDELGVIWDPRQQREQQMLEAARRFHAAHGHLDVPAAYRDSENRPIGPWLGHHRASKKSGTLAKEIETQLVELGVKWEPSLQREQEMLEAARQFHAAHGHLDIPVRFRDSENRPIGPWLGHHRASKKSGTLAKEIETQLVELGIVWDPRLENDGTNGRGGTWKFGFSMLKAFASETGSANPPADHVTPEGYYLGGWLNAQRVRLRSGKLAPSRKALLDELGVIWDPRQQREQEMLEAARRFHAAHGHLDIPVAYRDSEDLPIGQWLRQHRANKRSDRLPRETEKQLDELGVRWEPSLQPEQKIDPGEGLRELQWSRMFGLLTTWMGTHGHANVPSSFVTADEDRLGQWVAVQRRSQSQGRLNPRRKTRLDEIGFSWSKANPPRKQWTPESALASIREAATFEFPLSVSKFRGLIDDGFISGPGLNYLVDQFGGWTRACEIAGVESGLRPTFRFTESLILDAVRDFLESGISNPSISNYKVWAAEQAGRPSSTVVCSNFGGWKNGIRAALERYPDLRRPQ